jgi:hypothetical protein
MSATAMFRPPRRRAATPDVCPVSGALLRLSAVLSARAAGRFHLL